MILYPGCGIFSINGILGVGANGQQLLRTPKTILKPPELSAGRGDQEEKPSTIKELLGLFSWLDGSDSGVGERRNPFRYRTSLIFGGISVWGGAEYPPYIPPNLLDFILSHWMLSDNKKRKRPDFSGLSGQRWTLLNLMVVEMRGIEPLTSALRTLRSPN